VFQINKYILYQEKAPVNTILLEFQLFKAKK
jgi:hypothetical protein